MATLLAGKILSGEGELCEVILEARRVGNRRSRQRSAKALRVRDAGFGIS